MLKSVSDSLNECLSDMADIDLDYLYCSAEQLLSEDIWKKFDCDVPMAELDDIFSALDASVPDIFLDASNDLREIRNHDCMWAGHCGSKEHPADELKKLLPLPIIPPAAAAKTPAVKQQAAGRSVLIKPSPPVVKAPPPVVPSPESPPISDDENATQTSTLKMLKDAINECDLEEDSDLCEYFEEGEGMVDPDDDEEEEEEEEEEDEPRQPSHFAVESDHSYHKGKNASMCMTNLGVDTPSDSEEEIDVVSINEKQNVFISRTNFALPTNPSNRDKQHLQRKVASAITSKHVTTKHGLKMIPPVRKCSSMSKKRLTESARGIKRSKQHCFPSPYKRRNVSQQVNSSDSEPELEKRSLHNNMERQRRIDLRNSFEDLRMLVPEVSSRERAAKVVILREAAMYCDHLGDASESMQRKVVELRRRQEFLRARVSQLRKNLAANR